MHTPDTPREWNGEELCNFIHSFTPHDTWFTEGLAQLPNGVEV